MVKNCNTKLYNIGEKQIKYTYNKNNDYIKKSTYLLYPYKHLLETILFDENNNIIDYKIYNNNNRIYKHYKKNKSGYLKSVLFNKKYNFIPLRYAYKFKNIIKNNDEYFYVKCYEKYKSKYLKTFTDIYKNDHLHRTKIYDLNENLIKDEIIMK